MYNINVIDNMLIKIIKIKKNEFEKNVKVFVSNVFDIQFKFYKF